MQIFIRSPYAMPADFGNIARDSRVAGTGLEQYLERGLVRQPT
jgi:hypothetical protein